MFSAFGISNCSERLLQGIILILIRFEFLYIMNLSDVSKAISKVEGYFYISYLQNWKLCEDSFLTIQKYLYLTS